MASTTRDHELEAVEAREQHYDEEEMPRLRLTRRNLLVGAVFVLAALAFLYFGLPQLAGLDDTWRRIEEGDPWWLALALVFTVGTFAGYIAIFQGVYNQEVVRLDWRTSYQITMAGLAATRLLAAGGAGGIALTAWALRRAGMARRRVADATIAFIILNHAIYMAALVVGGLGLWFGVFEGPRSFAITVVPALFGLAAIGVFLAMALIPTDLERRLSAWANRHDRPRLARVARRLATAPAAASSGVRGAVGHLDPRDPALLGSLAFWGFNILILWAAFHAFGGAPPPAVLVVGYFVGMLGNLLPLPGGVGGVDGGMIGAFVAFGLPFGEATVAVLTYRLFAFWLPTVPGVIAYFQLRRTVNRWRTTGGPAAAGAHYTL